MKAKPTPAQEASATTERKCCSSKTPQRLLLTSWLTLHRSIYTHFYLILTFERKEKRVLDDNISDFDGTKLHISQTPNNDVQVSIASPGIKAVAASFKLKEDLSEYLGKAKLSVSSTEAEFDLTVTVSPSSLNSTTPLIMEKNLIYSRRNHSADFLVAL